MKKIVLAALILAQALPCAVLAAPADSTKAAPPAGAVPMTMKEVKQKLGIVVFPAKGQKPEQQDKEEYECLMWSAEQAGIKPGQQPGDAKAAGDAAAAKVDSAAQGAAVKGAAKGAALGAMTGAIWGDAGEGAAIGAIGGAAAGRRAKKQAKANAKAQAEQQVNAETQKKIDAVKKGMGACLTSKGYTVQ